MLIDAAAWLFVAYVGVKLVGYLMDDISAFMRRERSPRLKERDRRRAAGEVRGGRAGKAFGDYFAGLLEDSVAAARASRRRRKARKNEKRAVDGVFVDLDGDGRWYADCDRCPWSSDGRRIEDHAKDEGANHARSHNTHDAEEDNAPNPATVQQPRLRVIKGGAAQEPDPADADPDDEHLAPEEPVVHTGPSPYDLPGGNRYGYRCNWCGETNETFLTKAAANEAGANHICKPTSNVTSTDTKGNRMDTEATTAQEIANSLAGAEAHFADEVDEHQGAAGDLNVFAENCEAVSIAPSTVALIQEAADAYGRAAAEFATILEKIQEARADFAAKDGYVAEIVGDMGSLADRSVLLG